MNKLIIGIIILIIAILALIVFFSQTNLTGSAVEDFEDNYSFTKAICNSTHYCEDYEIVCEGSKMISKTPISGSAVQFNGNWEDYRDPATINKECS
jgi:hypothetical protein